MGLDVTAHEHAELLPSHEWNGEECWEAGHVLAFSLPVFSQSLRGLVDNAEYLVSGRTEHLHDSYGGHSFFRELLARTVLHVEPEEVWNNPSDYVNAPFYELINFSDCEGVIGPIAADDLQADFEHFSAEIEKSWEPGWYLDQYRHWHKVFALAAKTGLVQFH